MAEAGARLLARARRGRVLRRRAAPERRGRRRAAPAARARAQAPPARQRHRPRAASTPTGSTRRRTAALRASFGAGPDDVVCGVVGRLVWEKGYREVFEAAARLRTLAPDVQVVVVGPDRRGEGRRDHRGRHRPGRARRRHHVPRHARRPRGPLRRRWTSTCSRRTARASRARRWRPPRWAARSSSPNMRGLPPGGRRRRQRARSSRSRDAGRARRRGRGDRRRRRPRRPRWAAAGRDKAEREFDERTVIDITLGVYEQLLGPPTGGRARDASGSPATATPTGSPSCTRPGSPTGSSPASGRRSSSASTAASSRSPDSFAYVATDGAADRAVGLRGRDRSTSGGSTSRSRSTTGSSPGVRRRAPRSSGRGAGCSRRSGTRRPRARDLPARGDPRGRGRRGRGRRGVGQLVVDAATARLAARGVDAVKVVAGSDNAAALRLYERCGFTVHSADRGPRGNVVRGVGVELVVALDRHARRRADPPAGRDPARHRRPARAAEDAPRAGAVPRRRRGVPRPARRPDRRPAGSRC